MASEWLPTHEWSLEQFVEHAKTVLLTNEDIHRFVQFTLAGKSYDPAARPSRVRLVPSLQTPAVDTLPLRATRDFDSLIGITTDLPFSQSIAVYPIPNFKDSLSKSNHLCKQIHNQVLSNFLFYLPTY